MRSRLISAGNDSLQGSTFYGAPGVLSAEDVTIVGGIGSSKPPTTERAYDRMPGNGNANRDSRGTTSRTMTLK